MKKIISFVATTLLLLTASFSHAQTKVVSVYGVPFGESFDISKYKSTKKDNRYFLSGVTESFVQEVEYTLSPDKVVTQAVVRFVETTHEKAIQQHKEITEAMFEKYQGKIEDNSQSGSFASILTDNADITIVRSYTKTSSSVAVLYRFHDLKHFVKNKL